ncbi:MAG: hypothetical protein K1X51_13100 [Rhodospirillaceae bacterium]|nr:hypothetical protein [Rhodospirillaceae bacterium]
MNRHADIAGTAGQDAAMVGIWGVILLVCAVLAGPGAAFAAAANPCAPSRNAITLDFTTKASQPIYNNRLTIAGIRNLFATRGQPLGERHQKALGVTYVETMLSMQAATRIKPQGRGFCVYLDRVEADFGWDRMEVYVASEYKPGSCEYRMVLDHENQHVGINQQALRDSAPRVRAALEAILRDQAPVYVASPDGAADRALTAIHGRMNGSLDAFQRIIAERNGVIDTDSNYEAVSQMCEGWDGDKKAPPRKRP